MITISSAKYGNTSEYDRFVHTHPHGWVTALSGWVRVLEKSFPHIRDESMILVDEKSDTLRGILPLCLVKSTLTGKRLVSMPFATLSTPLLSDATSANVIMPELEKRMQLYGASSVHLGVASPAPTVFLPSCFKISSVFKCHTLDLNRPIEEIRKKLHHTSLRPHVDRAAKAGAHIRFADKPEDIVSFHRLYSATRKRLFLPAMPLTFFKSIGETFSLTNNAAFLLAEIDGHPEAALMLLSFGNRVSAEALGWNANLKKMRIVTYLYWEAIKDAHKKGYTMFDFGRTAPENKNLMDFKKRWGTTVSDLFVYTYPQMSSVPRTDTKNSHFARLLRKLVFGLPQPLYKTASAFCYRHIG